MQSVVCEIMKITACILTALSALLLGCATTPPLPIDSNKAVLRLGDEIDVISLDGEYIPSLAFGFKRNPQIEIDPGKHMIELRYSAMQKTGTDDFVKFKSNPVTFNLIARGGDIFEVLHEGPDDISFPEKLNRNVPIRVVKIQTGTGPDISPVQNIPPVIHHVEQSESLPKINEKDMQPQLEQLKQLWRQMSTKERKEFMQWVIEE